MTGVAHLVEAYGCDPDPLRSRAALDELLRGVVAALDLHPIGEPLWHVFPGAGGVTGMWLLAESHLAVHTFPEHRSLALDVFCCRPVSGDLARLLVKAVGAQRVNQTAIERSLSEPPAPSPTRPRGNGDGRG